jgi:putative hydrolase of the HAD superfamily
MIQAVVSDFGGVLTSPLGRAFTRANEDAGIPLEALGQAMARATERDGEPPLFALERGEISETEFFRRLEVELEQVTGQPLSLADFGERLMAALEPNDAMFAYLRELRRRGLRLAILTNNVREWEQRWRSLLPIDDVFELVVDSAFVGARKPDPAIYALTLDRLGLPAEACAFVDDLEVNVEAARAAGMHGIVFRDTDQAIAELDALLDGRGAGEAPAA